mgnify:CR=1 FL=1
MIELLGVDEAIVRLDIGLEFYLWNMVCRAHTRSIRNIYTIKTCIKMSIISKCTQFLSLWNSLNEWYNMYEDPWKEIFG